MQDNKQQLLGFLTRLKKAIDADVVGQPESLRKVLGFEVLEWDQLEGVPARFARRWRYNVPAMDAESRLFEKPGAGYSVGSLDPAYPDIYGFRAGNLNSVACVSPVEVEAILGRAPIQYTPVPMPLHGNLPQPNQPRWWATAYYYKADTKALLALSYLSTDAQPPLATCLWSLSVEIDKGLPDGYLK